MKVKKDLPFQIDKIYLTKFQTGDKFLLKEITYKSEVPISFKGIYVGSEHIGICPIGVDRLFPEQIEEEVPDEITLEEVRRRVGIILSEPPGIVRETMINNLLI